MEQMEQGGSLSLQEVITWFFVGLMGAAVLGGLAIAWIIYASLTWPWYFWKWSHRVAHPH